MPGDERLAEADGVDQVADGGRSLAQPPHDAQAVHVRQRLVEDAQLAQVVGLIDDRGDGAPDVRWGRQNGWPRVSRAVVPGEPPVAVRAPQGFRQWPWARNQPAFI